MALSRLGGSLLIRPGQQPAIIGSRPLLAARLLRGQPGDAAVQRLPLLYSLCGQAHRLTARLAVNAARQGTPQLDPLALQALQAENRREHLRRLVIDWPARLGFTPPAIEVLREWELAPEATMSTWLDSPLATWLSEWQADPRQTLRAWTQRSGHWLAAALAACRDDDLPLAVRPLRLGTRGANASASLGYIAEQLRSTLDFPQHPDLQGLPCETGCWTREAQTAPEQFDSSWLRLGAHVAELARLALPQPAELAMGALQLAPGEGLAWSETARGLLIHRVCLEPEASGGRICDYQVIAPTEWNLHPHGALARALAALAPGTARSERQARLLMAAYDPCIPFTLAPHPSAEPGPDDHA